MQVFLAIPIFQHMAEQKIKQNTSVMSVTSTLPTKPTQGPTLFQGTPGLRQSFKLDSSCQRRPNIQPLRPLYFLVVGQFTGTCY